MRFHTALLSALFLLAPPAASDDAPAGSVRLSRVEYDRLKDDSDGPAAPVRRKVRLVPPSVESARYEVRIDPAGVAVELSAEVVVRAPATDARLELPPAGRLDSFADRGPAPVLLTPVPSPEARVLVRFTAAGRYHLTARYVPIERDGSGGTHVYEFTTAGAASARLSAAPLPAGTTAEWSAASAAAEPLTPGASRPMPVSAVVRLRVRTGAAAPASAERPVVIADVVDAARPQRERLIVRTVVKLAVSRAELQELPLEFAPGCRLLSVAGPDEPTLALDGDGRGILRFGKPLRGDATFSALTWRGIPADGKMDLRPTRVTTASALRSFLLVTPASIRRYEPVSNDGLQRMDSSDLPPLARPFVGGSTRAYRAPDAAKALLVFSSPLIDVAPAADTLVDETSLLTVFGDGGVRTDQRRYSLQTKRPYFEVPVGEGDEILSVSVDDVPVKSQGQRDRLVVVLPSSEKKRRVVQVVTKHAGAEFPRKGELRVDAGPLAASASVGTWTVVFPEDRRYRFLESEGLRKAGWVAGLTAQETVAQVEASNWLGADANATLSGRVSDDSGLPLPGATIEARAGSVRRTTVTDAGGNYRFAGLPPGRYTVTPTLMGFSASSRSVDVKPGGGYLQPLIMTVSVRETVTVTAQAAGVAAPPPASRSLQSGVDKRSKQEPTAAEEGVEGGVSGGVMGGVLGGTAGPGLKSLDNQYLVDGVTQSNERSNAGVRSLPVEVTARGKRLVLSGPLAGAGPLWVRVAVK